MNLSYKLTYLCLFIQRATASSTTSDLPTPIQQKNSEEGNKKAKKDVTFYKSMKILYKDKKEKLKKLKKDLKQETGYNFVKTNLKSYKEDVDKKDSQKFINEEKKDRCNQIEDPTKRAQCLKDLDAENNLLTKNREENNTSGTE